jgi:hypothetical protein
MAHWAIYYLLVWHATASGPIAVAFVIERLLEMPWQSPRSVPASSHVFMMGSRIRPKLPKLAGGIPTACTVEVPQFVARYAGVERSSWIQSVTAHMLVFFSELSLVFPKFPYIAHSRGWSREDMERNVSVVRDSAELRQGAGELASRCLSLARRLIDSHEMTPEHIIRGGRKAHTLDTE